MLLRKAVPFLAALLALAACGTANEPEKAAVPAPVSADELAKVTLKVGDQKGGSKALLTAAGLLDALPYRIEWATFTSDPPLLEAVSPGGVHLGLRGKTIGVAKGSSAHGQILYTLNKYGLSTKDVTVSFPAPPTDTRSSSRAPKRCPTRV